MLRLLILDDDPLFGRTLERSLSRNDELPCVVTAVTTDQAAYALVASCDLPFDVFLVDQRLGPGPDGISVVQELLRFSPTSSAIIFASFDLDSGMQAYRAGAFRYLHKPFRPQELILILRSLCDWRATRTERDGLRILADIAEDAQRAHDIASLGAVIVGGACRFGFGRARLWLLDEQGALLTGLSCAGDSDDLPISEMVIAVHESPYMRRLFAERAPVLFRGDELGPTYLSRHYPPFRPPDGEWVSMPLFIGDRCLGVLSLDHAQHLAVRPDQMIELKLLAQQAAAALGRVQLAEQERRRSRELEVLTAIGRRTMRRAAHGDLHALLVDIHTLVKPLLDARHFYAVLRDDEANQNEYWHLSSADEPYKRSYQPQHTGLGGVVIADNAPLLLETEERIRTYRQRRRVRRQGLLPGIQCFLGVPLQVDGRAIGALMVLSPDRAHAYNAESQRLLTAVAAQVAGAIQVTMLKKDADMHTARLAILQRANEALLELGQLNDYWLWHIALTLATAYYGLGFNRAALFLLDRQGRVLKGAMGIGQLTSRTAKLHWRADVKKQMNFDDYLHALTASRLRQTEADAVVRELVLPLDEAGVFRAALEQRATQVVEGRDDALPVRFRAQFGDTTYAVVPLLVGEKRLGVVIVDNMHNGAQIEAILLRELETLLAQVALVYENVRQRRANDRLIQVSHTVLAEVVNISLHETLTRISDAAKEIAGADSVSIHPLQPNMPAETPVYDLEHIGQSGLTGMSHLRARPRPDGVTLEVLQTGRPRCFNDVSQSEWNGRPLLEKDRFLYRHGIRAYIAVPIRDALIDQRIGVLFLNYNVPQTFSDHDVRRAQWFADLAGSAIRTGRAEQAVIESRNAAEYLSQARGRELQILQDVLQTALQPAVDPAAHQDVVAQALLTAACDLLHVDETQVALVLRNWEAVTADQPHEVRHQYFLSGDRQLVTERRAAVYTGITGEVLRSGRDELIDDVTEPPWSAIFRPRHEDIASLNGPPTRSELDVLIKLEDHQILGLFNLESTRIGAFTEAHRQTLRRLAAVGALALNSLQRQHHMLNVLHVAQSMILATDVSTTLEAVLHAAGALARDVSAVTIWYKDPQSGKIISGPSFGLREIAPQRSDDHQHNAVLHHVMQSPDPIWAETIGDTSPLSLAFVPREVIVSVAAFPLRTSESAGGDAIGALFFNYRNHHTFSHEEQVLFPLLATIAAASVRDALRLQSVQAERKRLAAITRITEAVGATLDLDETLRRIMRTLSEQFPDDSPALLTYNSMRETLEFHPAALDFYRFAFADGVEWIDVNGDRTIACRVARRSIQTGEAEVENVGDVSIDPNYLQTLSATRSELCCSLMGVSEQPPRLLGVLILESPRLHAFTSDDVALMKGIGLAVSTALDRTYSSAQLRFASSVATATAWVQEIAHDINNEIGTIRRQAYFLSQQLQEFQLPQRFISQIDASAGRLAEFARAPRLENVQSLDLNAWLQQYVTEIVAKSRRSAGISHCFDFAASAPWVCVPPIVLERAVRHLVRNALESMGKEGRLTVRTVSAGREVEVQIANTGQDIPKDVRQTLFLEQVTSKGEERQSDAGGLGLLFVRWAIESMKGKVYLLSKPGDEVTFAFKLPLAEAIQSKE